jgi:hypothetical protein
MDIQKVLRRTLATSFVVSLGALAVYGYADIYAAPMRAGVYCARCDRVLVNTRVSGEIVANKYVSQPFRTIRCMLTHLKGTEVDPARVFVADYSTARPVPVRRAHFVRVPATILAAEHEYGIGDYDYVAFKSERAAERLAEKYGTTPRSWTEIREAETAVALVADAHAAH